MRALAAGWVKRLLPVLAVLLLISGGAPDAVADAGTTTGTTTTGTTTTGTTTTTATTTTPYVSPACKQYAGLTNRLASCIRATINGAAAQFYDPNTGFYRYVQRAITAFATLAVIIYGIMLAYGMVERVGRDTMVFLLKLSAVIAFCSNSQMLYDMTLEGMDGAAAAVIRYVPPSGTADNAGTDFSQSECLRTMTEQQEEQDDGNGPRVVGPWLGIDCLLDTVIGIRVPMNPGDPVIASDIVWYNKKFDAPNATTPQNQGMSRALMYLFFSGLETSILGIILAATGFFFILGLLMVIMKAFFTYIAGYMGVALLIIISPMIIPLVLLNSATKQYFDKWLKLVISFALQPVIMLVFITFSLAAVDLAAFSGKYSIMYRIAGEASREQGFSLNEYLTTPRDDAGNAPRDAQGGRIALTGNNNAAIVSKKPKQAAQIKGDTDKPLTISAPSTNGVFNVATVDCSKKKTDADAAVKAACNAVQPIMIKLQSINWKQMALAREVEGQVPVDLSDGATDKGQQISREVMAAVLFCAIVVFILNGLLSVVPLVAHDLLGDAGQSPDLIGAMGKTGGIGGMMSGMANKLKGAMK